MLMNGGQSFASHAALSLALVPLPSPAAWVLPVPDPRPGLSAGQEEILHKRLHQHTSVVLALERLKQDDQMFQMFQTTQSYTGRPRLKKQGRKGT